MDTTHDPYMKLYVAQPSIDEQLPPPSLSVPVQQPSATAVSSAEEMSVDAGKMIVRPLSAHRRSSLIRN